MQYYVGRHRYEYAVQLLYSAGTQGGKNTPYSEKKRDQVRAAYQVRWFWISLRAPGGETRCPVLRPRRRTEALGTKGTPSKGLTI